MRSRIQSSGPPSRHCRMVTARPGRRSLSLMLNSMTMGALVASRSLPAMRSGHERFTSIDRVENNGLDLTGAFHSDRWGDFQTYFRFQLSHAGKISRLDIGQAT